METMEPLDRPIPKPSNTMLSYIKKLPSKPNLVEETNPRRSAPIFNRHHVNIFQKTKLIKFDSELYDGNVSDYITEIKAGKHKPFKVRKKKRGPLRARLLQYHEDVRPPYFGTWQRTTKIVTGRRPFAQDEEVFDYEVDSEAEWDLGGPGESLKGDDSEDEEELDDYEIDMKTFVPHGYVSDDEIEVLSDQEENTPSANQSIEEPCDDNEDDSSSIQIICEKGLNSNGNEVKQSQQQNRTTQNKSPNNQVPAIPVAKATTKQEMKPISLGLYYEDKDPILSQAKIQFLKAFQGVSCN